MAIYINTHQNVHINYEISSIGSRILAYLIDGGIIIGLVLAFGFIFGFENEWVWMLVMLPVFFYHLICELSMNGQSIGKRSVKIKVMKRDGSSATFTSYFLRFLLRPIDSLYFIGLVFIFFTEKGQRLGDLAAGTIMVKVQEDITIASLTDSFNTAREDIQYPEVSQLKDRDVEIIKQVLTNWKEQPNHENVELLAQKIQDLLGVQTNEPPYAFLKIVVENYHVMYA